MSSSIEFAELDEKKSSPEFVLYFSKRHRRIFTAFHKFNISGFYSFIIELSLFLAFLAFGRHDTGIGCKRIIALPTFPSNLCFPIPYLNHWFLKKSCILRLIMRDDNHSRAWLIFLYLPQDRLCIEFSVILNFNCNFLCPILVIVFRYVDQEVTTSPISYLFFWFYIDFCETNYSFQPSIFFII